MKKATIEILRCFYGHDVQCITINDLRIAGGKCCGQWKAVRRWEVDESSLLRDLKRARIEVGAATSADAQAWHCGTEIAANQLLKRVEELEDAIAELLAARGDGAQGFGRLRQLMASAEPRSS